MGKPVGENTYRGERHKGPNQMPAVSAGEAGREGTVSCGTCGAVEAGQDSQVFLVTAPGRVEPGNPGGKAELGRRMVSLASDSDRRHMRCQQEGGRGPGTKVPDSFCICPQELYARACAVLYILVIIPFHLYNYPMRWVE